MQLVVLLNVDKSVPVQISDENSALVGAHVADAGHIARESAPSCIVRHVVIVVLAACKQLDQKPVPAVILHAVRVGQPVQRFIVMRPCVMLHELHWVAHRAF